MKIGNFLSVCHIWCKFSILYDLVIKVTDSCEITIAYELTKFLRWTDTTCYYAYYSG